MLKLIRIAALRGPNRWSRTPVLEAWVEIGSQSNASLQPVAPAQQRLTAWLPNLSKPIAPPEPSANGSAPLNLAELLQQVASELVVQAGPGQKFGATRSSPMPDQYVMAISCPEESVARACLLAARDMCLAALHNEAFALEARLKELRELYDTVCLGPSTRAIVGAAAVRDIPACRLNRRSLVQLGLGARQRRIMTAETNHTGAIAESISQDKELTKRLLHSMGVPVPEGRAVDDAEDAWKAARDIEPPVVVKPRDGNHGRGVFTNLNTREEIMIAYEHAAKEGDGVIVERYIPGAEHRVLVVGNRVIAATRGEAAFVTGDGRQTVEQLVEEQLNSDPRRGDDYASPLSKIDYDPTTIAVLERQGLTVQSVPAAGRSVLIQVNGNLANDVTDLVHPEVEARAVEAARAVGLDIAGIDIVITDISHPMEEQRAAVVEVNAGPGLQMHLQPSTGKPRPVGEAIVHSLFPPGESGRIPVIGVAGVHRTTQVARLLGHLLETDGQRVGVSTHEGVSIGRRQIDTVGLSTGAAMRNVLINPLVDAAVLEITPQMVAAEGLGIEDCDVAVITAAGNAMENGTAWHDELGEHDLAERLLVESVRRCGTAVLPAGEATTNLLCDRCACSVVLYGVDGAAEALARHRSTGGRAVYVDNKRIVASDAHRQQPVVSLGRLAAASKQQSVAIEDLLAASAAAWFLGIAPERIGDQLATFVAMAGQMPVVVLQRGAVPPSVNLQESSPR